MQGLRTLRVSPQPLDGPCHPADSGILHKYIYGHLGCTRSRGVRHPQHTTA